MRILHTSDWHLGRTLHGVDLMDHQAAYLDHLVETARDTDADAVLVAGDVYDRAIPPVEAVSLLSDAVARLSEVAPVVVTPGNHDSAVRLGFGAGLMRDEVHFRARVADIGTPVVLAPGRYGGATAVYAVPYLDPDATRWELADTDPESGADVPLARSHEAVMTAAMRRVSADLAARRPHVAHAVVMAHAFVVGGQASESERDIRVGGVDAVPAGVFGGRGVDYVALGHLHGPQQITVPGADGGQGSTIARYSGSPLAYSFSETRHRKSTVLTDLATGTTETIPAPVPRRLAEVTGTLEQVLGASGEGHEDDWLRVVVTDEIRPRDLYARVKERFPYALQVTHRPPEHRARETIAVVGPARDPLDVTREFVEHVTGASPTTAETTVLRRAVEGALAAERSA